MDGVIGRQGTTDCPQLHRLSSGRVYICCRLSFWQTDRQTGWAHICVYCLLLQKPLKTWRDRTTTKTALSSVNERTAPATTHRTLLSSLRWSTTVVMGKVRGATTLHESYLNHPLPSLLPVPPHPQVEYKWELIKKKKIGGFCFVLFIAVNRHSSGLVHKGHEVTQWYPHILYALEFTLTRQKFRSVYLGLTTCFVVANLLKIVFERNGLNRYMHLFFT